VISVKTKRLAKAQIAGSMLSWMQIAEQYAALPVPLKSFLTTAASSFPIVLVIAWIGGHIYLWRRETIDRAERALEPPPETIAQEFDLPVPPDPESAVTQPMRARASIWRQQLHERAIQFKDKYYEIIGRCGFLLASVFTLLAFELTILRSQTQLERYFVTTDLAAVSLVLFFWWRARITNQAWIAKRIQSELVRQWLQLVFAFSWAEAQIEVEFEPLLQRLENAIVEPKFLALRWLGFGLNSRKLESRIQAYWQDLQKDLRAQALTRSFPNERLAILSYIFRRPIGQLQWYRMRQRQFARAGKRRSLIMLLLFLFSFALTLWNVVLVHWLNASQTKWPSYSSITCEDWLNFLLLIATALSAALTYWYVSRNERSISHRYGSQRREIEIWLKETARLIKENEVASIVNHVLEFEAIMISELIDWVHITSHDRIELTT
jgi:hypothetical protein